MTRALALTLQHLPRAAVNPQCVCIPRPLKANLPSKGHRKRMDQRQAETPWIHDLLLEDNEHQDCNASLFLDS